MAQDNPALLKAAATATGIFPAGSIYEVPPSEIKQYPAFAIAAISDSEWTPKTSNHAVWDVNEDIRVAIIVKASEGDGVLKRHTVRYLRQLRITAPGPFFELRGKSQRTNGHWSEDNVLVMELLFRRNETIDVRDE